MGKGMPTDNLQVSDNRELSRYEIHEGKNLIGFSVYDLSKDVITFIHTEIEPEFEDQGYGETLVKTMLEDVRENTALRVEPVCPFVNAYMRRHPDYEDLLTR